MTTCYSVMRKNNMKKFHDKKSMSQRLAKMKAKTKSSALQGGLIHQKQQLTLFTPALH